MGLSPSNCETGCLSWAIEQSRTFGSNDRQHYLTKKKTTDNTSAASRTPDPAAASRSSAAESVKSGHPASGGVPHSHLIPDQRARGRRHAADLLLRGQPRGEEDVGAGAHGRRVRVLRHRPPRPQLHHRPSLLRSVPLAPITTADLVLLCLMRM